MSLFLHTWLPPRQPLILKQHPGLTVWLAMSSPAPIFPSGRLKFCSSCRGNAIANGLWRIIDFMDPLAWPLWDKSPGCSRLGAWGPNRKCRLEEVTHKQTCASMWSPWFNGQDVTNQYDDLGYFSLRLEPHNEFYWGATLFVQGFFMVEAYSFWATHMQPL